jgi:chemotaxis protein histidine kinase CheA
VTAEAELLDAFAREARGRTEAIAEAMRAVGSGSSPAPDTLEALRREAHTLKGTAAVLELERLSDLAARMEEAIRAATDSHQIEPETAAWLERSAVAFREGANAAADGAREPDAVAEAIAESPAE